MPDSLQKLLDEGLDQMLKEMPPEKRLKGLTAEEVIRGLSPETLEALRQQLKANGSPPKPQ